MDVDGAPPRFQLITDPSQRGPVTDHLGISAHVPVLSDAELAESVRRAERSAASPDAAWVDRGGPGVPEPRGGSLHRPRVSVELPRVWLDDATMPAHETALVKGLIGTRDLVMVYGEPGCGKTFLVLDIAGHIATGMPWRGLRTKAGLVVYIAAEAGRSILRRFIAWRDHHVGEARESRIPLAIITRGVNVMLPVEVEELMMQLRAIAAEADVPLAMVVFDTLSRSMPGGDENGPDMLRVVAAADRIRDELGAASLIVHHTGKDKTKGARGHSSLRASTDAVICVEDRVATVERVRDGVSGQTFAFALEVVELGNDSDGDPITTCVLVEAEAGEATASGPRTAGLKKHQQTALDVLRDMRAKARRNLRDRGEDPAEVFVEVAAWRKAVMAKGVDVKRIKEVQDSLTDRRLIAIDFPHVTLIEKTP